MCRFWASRLDELLRMSALQKQNRRRLEARTAVADCSCAGEDGQLGLRLLIQMTMKPRRDAAMAPVWPGIVLPRR